MPFAYEDFDFLTRDPLFDGPKMVLNKKLRRYEKLSTSFYVDTYSQLYNQDLWYYKNVTQKLLERRLKFSHFKSLTFYIFKRIKDKGFLLGKKRYDAVLPPGILFIVKSIISYSYNFLANYIFSKFFMYYNDLLKRIVLFHEFDNVSFCVTLCLVYMRRKILNYVFSFLINCIRHKKSLRKVRFPRFFFYIMNFQYILFIYRHILFLFKKCYKFVKVFFAYSQSKSMKFYNKPEYLSRPMTVFVNVSLRFYSFIDFDFTIKSKSRLSFYFFSLHLFQVICNRIKNCDADDKNLLIKRKIISFLFHQNPINLYVKPYLSLYDSIYRIYTYIITLDPFLKKNIDDIHYIFPKIIYGLKDDLFLDKFQSLVSNKLPLKNFFTFYFTKFNTHQAYLNYSILYKQDKFKWDAMKNLFFNSFFKHLPPYKIPVTIDNYKVFNRFLRSYQKNVNDKNFFLEFNVKKKIIGMRMRHGFLTRTQNFVQEVFFQLKTLLGSSICSRLLLGCVMILRPNAAVIPYHLSGKWTKTFKPIHTYRRYFEGLRLFKEGVDARFSDRLMGDLDWPYSSAMVMELYDVITYNRRCYSHRMRELLDTQSEQLRFLARRKRPSSLYPYDKDKLSLSQFRINRVFKSEQTKLKTKTNLKRIRFTESSFNKWNKQLETRVSLPAFKPTPKMYQYNQNRENYFKTRFTPQYEKYDGFKYTSKYDYKKRNYYRRRFSRKRVKQFYGSL